MLTESYHQTVKGNCLKFPTYSQNQKGKSSCPCCSHIPGGALRDLKTPYAFSPVFDNRAMEILRFAALIGIHRTSWAVLAAAGGFSAVVFAVILCAKTAVNGLSEEEGSNTVPGRSRKWIAVKKRLMNAIKSGRLLKDDNDELLRSSEASFLCDSHVISAEEGRGISGANTANGSTPPVWQRKIMMGERCELPTFSGLILYDEQGNPLPNRTHHHAGRQKADFR